MVTVSDLTEEVLKDAATHIHYVSLYDLFFVIFWLRVMTGSFDS